MKSIINGVLSDNENIDKWRQKGFVYEVLRVIDNKPLFLKEHLIRMKKSVNDLDVGIIENDINKIIESYEGLINNNLFISVNIENQDSAIFIIKGFYPPEEWYEKGIKINTFEIKRNNPTKKIYDENYKKKIEEHLNLTGVFETLITDDGEINEGSRSNVFFIKGNVVFTPPVDAVLPGITRDKVFEVARIANIKIKENNINKVELNTYDGAFITGTSIDLLPISNLDGIEYKTTKLECFKELLNKFKKIKEKDLKANDK